MKAGNVIILKPNTYVKKGSLYLARIEPCTFCELNFSFSNFFTPNQDGYNDYWEVSWFNPIEFSEVSIFDRYGKLIKTLKPQMIPGMVNTILMIFFLQIIGLNLCIQIVMVIKKNTHHIFL